MNLTYQTGRATLIQFVVMALFNMAGALNSIISTCSHTSGQCVTNMLTSTVFYLLIIFWFGIIVFLGFRAQLKRDRRIGRLLIIAECLVFVIAGYNIKSGITYHNGALSLFTSLADLILSVWVITLAYKLVRAKGGRIVHHHINDSDNKPTL